MSASVLLARPYPFLVEDMKPFLEEDGYSVEKAEQDGDGLQRTGYAGAVIALASLSEVKLQPGEVLARLRAVDPALPVVFAGLLALDSYEATLVRLAEHQGISARLLSVDPACENAPELSTPEGFLYLQRNDLQDPDQRGRALKMIRRHFR